MNGIVTQLVGKCESIIKTISDKINQINDDEKLKPELISLLELKRQFLIKIKELFLHDVNELKNHLEIEKIQNWINDFKTDLESLLSGLNNLGNFALENQIDWLKFEYTLFLEESHRLHMHLGNKTNPEDDAFILKLRELISTEIELYSETFKFNENDIIFLTSKNVLYLLNIMYKYLGNSDKKNIPYLLCLIKQNFDKDNTIIILKKIISIRLKYEVPIVEISQFIESYLNFMGSFKFTIDSIHFINYTLDFYKTMGELEFELFLNEYRHLLNCIYNKKINVFSKDCNLDENLRLLTNDCSFFIRNIFVLITIRRPDYLDLSIELLKKEKDFVDLNFFYKNILFIIKKYKGKSLIILKLLSEIEGSLNFYIINKKKEFYEFIDNFPILEKKYFSLYFELATEKERKEFIQQYNQRIAQIKAGNELGEDFSEEDINIIMHTFYPSQISYDFNNYKNTLLTHKTRNQDLPESIRNLEVNFKMDSTILSPKVTTFDFERVLPEICYESEKQLFNEVEKQFKVTEVSIENLVVLLKNFNKLTINNQLNELENDDTFINLRKDFLYYYLIWTSRRDEKLFLNMGLSFDYKSIQYYLEFFQDSFKDRLMLIIEKISEDGLIFFNEIPIIKKLLDIELGKLEKIPEIKRGEILDKNGILVRPNNVTASDSPTYTFSIYKIRDIIHKLLTNNIIKQLVKIQKEQFIIKKGSVDNYIFSVSKKQIHSCLLLNMGVCIGCDEQLWNDPSFWQLIIFDSENIAQGGVIIRSLEDAQVGSNRSIKMYKYLLVSINPSPQLLERVRPDVIYDKIMKILKVICIKLDYDGILIPTNENISSNRNQINELIRKQKYEKMTVTNFYFGSYYQDKSLKYYVDGVYIAYFRNKLRKILRR